MLRIVVFQNNSLVMEVPIHSTKSSRSSLSKKAAISRKSVRSVLQTPYTLQWPMVKDGQEIKEVLLRLLTPIQRKVIPIPWSVVRRMTPEERRIARKEAIRETDESKELRKGLYYGMNSFIHGIQHNNVASAILSDDVEPKLLINIIIQLAITYCIPIIILPGMKHLSKCALGFSSCCIAVKKIHLENESSYFYPLHKIILEFSKEFEFPENVDLKKDELFQSSQLLNKGENLKIKPNEIEPVSLKKTLNNNAFTMDFTMADDSSHFKPQESSKKDFQKESFGIDKQSSRKKSHPYLRNFKGQSPGFYAMFNDAEYTNLDNCRINEDLETERQGDTTSSKSKQDNCSQACDRRNPSSSIPVTSQRIEKRLLFHPYKSLKIAEVGGCRKSLPNTK